MKERPILFSAAMVRAILEDRKTQTRRVMKPQPLPCDHTPPYSNPRPPMRFVSDVDGTFHCPTCGNGVHYVAGPKGAEGIRCPHGIPGDRLWVRETFCLEGSVDGEIELFDDGRPVQREHDEDSGLSITQPHYRATDPMPELDCCNDKHEDHGGPCPTLWRPSIFMPRWASRITLEITDVRVQRVQEISEDDAIAEGAMEWWNSLSRGAQEQIYSGGRGPCGAFRDLWDSINAKRGFGWDKNPWVWALTFRRLP